MAASMRPGEQGDRPGIGPVQLTRGLASQLERRGDCLVRSVCRTLIGGDGRRGTVARARETGAALGRNAPPGQPRSSVQQGRCGLRKEVGS